MNVLYDRLTSSLARLPPAGGLCLAYSGGLDSSVLLDVLCRAGTGPRLRAVHINHNLQPQADEWAGHCRQRCRHYAVPLQVIDVNAAASPGESPEAAARRARYRAFEDNLSADECLLTAQHRDDQAETVMLQLLRGSGPEGLAGMPELTRFGAGWLARPFLRCSRADIQLYADTQKLPWVEDNSNSELNYDRNYLRTVVMPVLLQRWPGAARTLARAADLQAQMSEILHQLGADDTVGVQSPVNSATLAVDRLRTLTGPRLRNALRYWIGRQGLATPSAGQLEQIVEALSARPDSTPVVSWPGGCVGRYRNSLYALSGVKTPPDKTWRWQPGQPLVIPEAGLSMDLEDLKKSGLAVDSIEQPLSVRFRSGGERICLPGRSHRHRLKKLLQERRVPPWLRKQLPLLFHGDELIAVLGMEPAIIADRWETPASWNSAKCGSDRDTDK